MKEHIISTCMPGWASHSVKEHITSTCMPGWHGHSMKEHISSTCMPGWHGHSMKDEDIFTNIEGQRIIQFNVGKTGYRISMFRDHP